MNHLNVEIGDTVVVTAEDYRNDPVFSSPGTVTQINDDMALVEWEGWGKAWWVITSLTKTETDE